MIDPRLHLVVPTHTTRHLGLCLASLARQTVLPRSVVVSCDTDDGAIPALLEECWARMSARWTVRPRLLHAGRPHQGRARLNQVRNNGLRALEAGDGLRDDALIVILDGDTMLHERALERHAARRDAGAEVVIPFRVNLSERATAGLSVAGILEDPAGLDRFIGTEDRRGLARRDARYRRHGAVRAWAPMLLKGHKPKVLGGHHAVTAGRLRAVNGYDEQFMDYGYDDDDLSSRLYRLRPRVRVAIAVRDILALHLWHPTRAPRRATEAPGYARFAEPGRPVEAERGWRSPLAQPEPVVRVIGAA